MTKHEKDLLKKARRLCKKFYDDAQSLFDDDAMSEELAAHPVFECLIGAQGYAEEAGNDS